MYIMAVASGPAGLVLAGPVSVFAFKTVDAQMINNNSIHVIINLILCSAWMQHCESND